MPLAHRKHELQSLTSKHFLQSSARCAKRIATNSTISFVHWLGREACLKPDLLTLDVPGKTSFSNRIAEVFTFGLVRDQAQADPTPAG